MKISTKLLLRTASVVMLLHTIGHCFGTFTWKQAPNEEVGKVVNGMLSVSFQFMGRNVSFGRFYEGYGIAMIFVMLLVVVMLWLLSAQKIAGFCRSMLLAICVFLIAFGITEYIYFFPFAASFSLFSGVLTLAALQVKEK